jgi:hypothetical protein
MLTFKTATGSTYEVDRENKRVRRVVPGTSGPCKNDRIGKGEWLDYLSLSEVALGVNVIIVWPPNVGLLPGSPVDAAPGTVTSPVIWTSEAS